MKRTKAPGQNNSKEVAKKPGPDSLCTPEVIDQAYKFCLLGLTNWQMARHFGVKENTIEGWYRKYPQFKDAVDQGRTFADSEVAKMLFQIATGQYTQPAVKFFKSRVTEKEYDPDTGELIREISYDKIIEQPYQKRFAPDTKAMIKWLGVRNRETWGESFKVEHDHRHAHMVAGNLNIHSVLEQISDGEEYSDEELKLIAKMGLQEIKQQEGTSYE